MSHAAIRVLHVMPNLDPAVGTGPAVVLSALASEQRRQGLGVTVGTTDPPDVDDRHAAPLRELGVKLHFTGPGRGPLRIGPTAKATIRHMLSEGVDLVHVRALWLHLPHCGAAEARRAGVPYVFSAPGMLEPWALKKGWLKKRAFMALLAGRDLRAGVVAAPSSLRRGRGAVRKVQP